MAKQGRDRTEEERRRTRRLLLLGLLAVHLFGVGRGIDHALENPVLVGLLDGYLTRENDRRLFPGLAPSHAQLDLFAPPGVQLELFGPDG